MADLLSVVVGGLLAVGGGAATQWYFDKRRLSEEKRTKKALKYEELIAAIYEHGHWLDTLRSIRVYGRNAEEPPSPYGKVFAITTVYFHEFVERVEEVNRLAGEYELWMFEKAQQRLNGNIKDLSEGGLNAHGPYYKARLQLISELRDLARKGFE